MGDLLVVAGEASGDRAAAAVVHALRENHDERGELRVFGMGGAALADAGVLLLDDLRKTTALGVGEVVVHACGLVRAHTRLVHAAQRRAPRAALLVNYTEFNARLAPRLVARGVRVLWYGAPQIWAWRPGRAESMRRSVDRMALMLPFEEPLWRNHGVDAHYVGHPAREVEARPASRGEARARLGLTPWAKAVAILPGSRPHEVRSLLGPMLAGYERVRRDRASIDARVLLAPSLDPRTRAWAIATVTEARVGIHEVDARLGAGSVLRAFDAALCASGTASLEAALAGTPPVVAYRVGFATEALARGLLETPFVALPNILLGRRVFAELLQRDAEDRRFATELRRALDSRTELAAACDEVLRVLGPQKTPSAEVARMLAPWLLLGRHADRFGPALRKAM